MIPGRSDRGARSSGGIRLNSSIGLAELPLQLRPILIPSNLVMLSKAMINNIDAENILSGKINNITLIGSKVRIFCNVGFDIVSDISEYSFKKMNLNINDEIYVIFKSENVKISYT